MTLIDDLKDSVAMLNEGVVTITPNKMLNTSGITPFDHRLLVKHDPISDTFEGTSLIRPDAERDKQKYAQTRATVIAVGDMCWAEARYDAERFGLSTNFPKAGDRVLVGRYTGDTHKGRDGEDYVVLNDRDVIAFLQD